jgi:protein arginine kinase activator
MPSDRCDHCDKAAVVHELLIKNGGTIEIHLCEEHAAAQGYVLPTHPPVHQLLTKLAMGGTGAGAGTPAAKPGAKAKTRTCPNCHRTIVQIKESGLLGCQQCYVTFEESLQTLIERSQAGANFHLGRSPRGHRDAQARHELRSKLVRELDEAVTAEQYERAAKLRDRIHELSADDE